MRIFTLTSAAVLMMASLAAAAPASPTPAIPVVWDSPSADSRGSMPIGNGDIRANVWVEPSGDLLLLLSKSDAWDELARLCKLGRIRIKLPSVAGFRQELRSEEGEIRIVGGGVTTRVWIDANHPVIHVELQGTEPFTTSVTHETWRNDERILKGGETRSSWGQRDSRDPLKVSPDTVIDGLNGQIVFFHRNPSSVWANNLRKHLTRLVFNHDGAQYPETMEFWGTAPDRDFSRFFTPTTRQRPGESIGYAQDYPQGALELLSLMNSYFEHTGDTAFRDTTLLPFGKAITDYYRLHWPRIAGGKLCFTGLTSLEQATNTTNPLPDIAGLRVILPQLAAYTRDPAQHAQWSSMLADLPPLPIKEIKGIRTLAMADKTPARVSGYEKPELYAPKNTTVECELRDGKITLLNVSPKSRRKDLQIPPALNAEGCGVSCQ